MNIEVKETENSMAAHITIIVNEGEQVSTLTEKMLYDALNKKGINTGLETRAIKYIISEKIYNQPVCIAMGIPSVAGKNASVKISKKPIARQDIVLPQTSDGNIDYYAPRKGFLVWVRKGEVLAKKYAPDHGTPGKDVFGKTIPGTLGKEISLELFKGKNTVIDKNKIIAETDGIVEVKNLRINVLKTFEIQENVGKNTGSIDLPLDLNCKLIVKGDIQRGYKISCSDLYVQGCIEDAGVTVNNLEVKEGIVGVSESKIIAKNISAGYINGSRELQANTITIEKEISQGAKIYCNVVKAYVIQGCTVVAKDAVWVDYVNGNNTITAGIDFKVKIKYDELQKMIVSLDNPVEELRQQDILNAKRMRQLAELARVNPKSPILLKELPKIKEAKIKLDNFIKKRLELINKKEELAKKIYSENDPFIFVKSNFGRDDSAINTAEPNTKINIKDKFKKINDITPGKLFIVRSGELSDSTKYNIKKIKHEFDKYFNATKDF
ncbi:flagellar assembly protein A [candidate division KSB1 bacterium]